MLWTEAKERHSGIIERFNRNEVWITTGRLRHSCRPRRTSARVLLFSFSDLSDNFSPHIEIAGEKWFKTPSERPQNQSVSASRLKEKRHLEAENREKIFIFFEHLGFLVSFNGWCSRCTQSDHYYLNLFAQGYYSMYTWVDFTSTLLFGECLQGILKLTWKFHHWGYSCITLSLSKLQNVNMNGCMKILFCRWWYMPLHESVRCL